MTRAEYNNNIKNWSGNVLRFAMWNCGDRMRGEDATQEAFAKLWENIERVPLEKGLGYLLTVTRHYLLDCFRHDTVVNRVHEEMVHTGERVCDERDDSLSDEMTTALMRLPEIQRTIMQLRDVDGYSYKEIANMLEISENQVQVYLFRARSTMKRFFMEQRKES